MYGSSRYLDLFPLGGSQQPQQSPQHLRHEKHEQQHERPQQAQRMMHQMIEKTISPPTIMTAMTGHLVAVRIETVALSQGYYLLAICGLHAGIPAGKGSLHIFNLSLEVAPCKRGP
jgi:hypothetical protein